MAGPAEARRSQRCQSQGSELLGYARPAAGRGYLEMFRGFGGSIARRLDGVRLPTPDVVYDGYDLDLGGRTVRLRPTGRGHTKGDQVMGEDEIVAEVRALLIERHPEWVGQEWIERGVGCLCTEHAA